MLKVMRMTKILKRCLTKIWTESVWVIYQLLITMRWLLQLYALRRGFKNPNHGFLPWWGGGTPLCCDFFPVTFLAGRLPWWGGGGYPPLPWLKNLLKIGPKTVFFRQKTPFLAKKFQAACRDGGGGGTPLCRDFFPVNFLAGRLPWWGEGGGTPITAKSRDWGFWTLPLVVPKLWITINC